MSGIWYIFAIRMNDKNSHIFSLGNVGTRCARPYNFIYHDFY
jgi:hypothetical protein